MYILKGFVTLLLLKCHSLDLSPSKRKERIYIYTGKIKTMEQMQWRSWNRCGMVLIHIIHHYSYTKIIYKQSKLDSNWNDDNQQQWTKYEEEKSPLNQNLIMLSSCFLHFVHHCMGMGIVPPAAKTCCPSCSQYTKRLAGFKQCCKFLKVFLHCCLPWTEFQA